DCALSWFNRAVSALIASWTLPPSMLLCVSFSFAVSACAIPELSMQPSAWSWLTTFIIANGGAVTRTVIVMECTRVPPNADPWTAKVYVPGVTDGPSLTVMDDVTDCNEGGVTFIGLKVTENPGGRLATGASRCTCWLKQLSEFTLTVA